MLLQISFDITDAQKALDIAEKVKDYCDTFEIGNLLLYAQGAQCIEIFKQQFPQKTIMIDSKIIEKGKEITSLLIDYGADWITVMGGTHTNIIHLVTETAHTMKKKVMMDVSDSLSHGQSALEAKNLGIDAIMFHQHYDEYNPAPFMEKWELLRGNTDLPIFIEARITKNTSEAILGLKPAGIIVGKSIMQAKDPVEETKFFYDLCKR